MKGMRAFLIVAGAILISGCVESKYISFKFEDVGLLCAGDPIIYRGVKIGKVKDINLQAGIIVVNAKVSLDAPIHISDTGKIQHSGMFGERQIVIASGSSKTMASEDDTLIGVYKKIEPQSINSLSELVDTIQSVRERFLVKKLLDSISTLNARIKILELQETSAVAIANKKYPNK